MTAESSTTKLDQSVRHYIYDRTLHHGTPPTMAQTAASLGKLVPDIRASFRRLADGRVIVLQKTSGEILMANPFSAVPTPFLVETSSQRYFANCIWDAFGVPAMLGQDAIIRTSCGDCGDSASFEVRNNTLLPSEGFAHFALPALQWWVDIIFN